MAAKLISEEGISKGLVLPLEEGEEWIIGRDPELCQLLIEDPSTSRRHMVARQTQQGVVVENLSRTNPILVNSAEIEGPKLLHHGDMVKIGASTFRFYTDAEAQLLDEPAPEEEIPYIPPIEEDFDSANEENATGMPSEPSEENPLPSPSSESSQSALPQPTTLPQPIDVTFPESSGNADAEDSDRHDTIFGEEDDHHLAEVSFDLSGSGRWLVKVISGPNNGAEFSMEKGHSYLVGTDATSCDIVFHDLSVSRQHARLSVTDDESLTIEDLGSRNGTQIDNQTIKGKTAVASNSVITIGTTSFVAIDRQQEQRTIVPPPIATFGQVVKNEETLQAVQAAVQSVPHELDEKAREAAEPPKKSHHLSQLILLGAITGLFLITGFGVAQLFHGEEVVIERVDTDKQLSDAFKDHPQLRYNFSKATGRLMILGHVMSVTDRSQLVYALQSLPFISKIDDNIIIDELVWQEANQVMSKNPAWRTMNITSPEPGRFVLTGFLKTRAEASELSDYLSLNFPYPELLEKKMLVEEDVLGQATQILGAAGFREVSVELANGELILTGYIPNGKNVEFESTIKSLKEEIPGIHQVSSQITEQQPEEMSINLSSQYQVTGFSNLSGANVSVVIKGRILTVGDTFEGMKVVSIKPGTIFLEKDGFKYRIDYNK